MPSGAKKRKAKKKKENQSNMQPNPSHGDDVKHQDDKESDVGGVSSSASQDHHNLLSSMVEEENVVQIEKELKIEDKLSDKSSSGSSSSSSKSSSICSSDDESHDIKNNLVVVDISPVVHAVRPADLLSETATDPIHTATIEEACVSDMKTPVVNEIVSLLEKTEGNKSSIGTSVSQEINSVHKKNGDEMWSCLEDKTGISASLVDYASEIKQVEGQIVVQSVENIAAISDPKKCVVVENEGTMTLSSGATGADIDNGADYEENYGETQPLLGDPVQKASWKSCCGLCELFTSRKSR